MKLKGEDHLLTSARRCCAMHMCSNSPVFGGMSTLHSGAILPPSVHTCGGGKRGRINNTANSEATGWEVDIPATPHKQHQTTTTSVVHAGTTIAPQQTRYFGVDFFLLPLLTGKFAPLLACQSCAVTKVTIAIVRMLIIFLLGGGAEARANWAMKWRSISGCPVRLNEFIKL